MTPDWLLPGFVTDTKLLLPGFVIDTSFVTEQTTDALNLRRRGRAYSGRRRSTEQVSTAHQRHFDSSMLSIVLIVFTSIVNNGCICLFI